MAYFKTIANGMGSIDNGINLYLETLKTIIKDPEILTINRIIELIFCLK